MKLYFVAGEASGDARGAELMRSLREREPTAEFHGLGGPQMSALAGGSRMRDWIERAGVLGIIDVLRNYRFFKQEFNKALCEIEALRPDAVVFIDYPGFNLRLAAALKKQARAPQVIYYISPQVWAWNRGRIPKMARVVDLMICIFPFEKALYEKSGLRTFFAGHPMLDSLELKRTNEPRDEKLVGLFPGSRDREVRKIFPVMLDAAEIIQRSRADVRFAASAASETMRKKMESLAARHRAVRCEIGLKNSHELMQRVAAGMVASGTATLEAAFFRLPFVLVYRAAWLTFFIGRRLVKVAWIGMPNILAGREVVREFLQEEAQPETIATEMLRLLNNRESREKLAADLGAVIALLGEPGASSRAAEAILQTLREPAKTA
jgi:lipid-A-disaccharide synthase